MKMKKLLSMGALALVLASSVSVGASAATITDGFSPKTKALINAIVKDQYQNGKNQTDLFAGVTKDSKISSIANADIIALVNAKYTTTDSAVRILEAKYDANPSMTFAAALEKVTKDETTFNKFKDAVVQVAEKIEAMDKLTGTTRGDSEKQLIAVTKVYNSNLKVNFGKDAKGQTSAILKENGKMLVQLNSDEVTSAINEINAYTYANAIAEASYLNTK
jgi:hypothetical protein